MDPLTLPFVHTQPIREVVERTERAEPFSRLNRQLDCRNTPIQSTLQLHTTSHARLSSARLTLARILSRIPPSAVYITLDRLHLDEGTGSTRVLLSLL